MDYIAPRLFVGSLRDAQNGEALALAGIAAVVNCCQEEPPYALYDALEINGLWVPFQDEVPLGEELRDPALRAFEFIARVRARREKVLVHCRASVSRSPALVAGYLFWAGEEGDFDAALSRVRALHPVTLPHYDTLASFKKLLCVPYSQEAADAYAAFWNAEAKRRGYRQ